MNQNWRRRTLTLYYEVKDEIAQGVLQHVIDGGPIYSTFVVQWVEVHFQKEVSDIRRTSMILQ